jgi:septum formation protein
MRVVLASGSPARLGVLRTAGLDPIVEVSEIDEDAVLAGVSELPPSTQLVALAAAKADAVAARLAGALPAAVVIGCDSMLALDGALLGKPADAEDARRCWAAMAGRSGELITGHAVRLLRDGALARTAEAAARTVVRFGRPTAGELDAYLASGEPLAVAGAFTLDGRGGWFVDGVDGDPSNVIGISLPLTRRLLAEVGVELAELWGSRTPTT